ncbi:hypothetical protein J25TS5_33350 [Paenibacillus faecis]|uniref:NBR1-Ig-like domain-containing protein n=1 Tax=Paenibacillus faecis TaxID=862114 RepID=UPI001B0B33EF|nr:NBR1-Ig-like domain-containing protein [Paenibacillus faecis]GIO86403.1 hypothetical protein J25TS5_33350 [Paenibacillus faecis]
MMKVKVKKLYSLTLVVFLSFLICYLFAYNVNANVKTGATDIVNLADNLEATIISDTVPEIMRKGTEYPVTITVRNDSNQTWAESNFIRLGAVGDSDPFADGRHLIKIGESVEPGKYYVFEFNMKAPLTTGEYISDWRMLKENVTWFGAVLEKKIKVVEALPARGATVIKDTIPDSMITGKSYTVTITVRNDGESTWSEKEMYRLGGMGDSDPFANARQYLPQGQNIQTGQTCNFTFTMTAPNASGIYTSDWQMLQEGVTWFGEKLVKQITVTSPYSKTSSSIYDASGRLIVEKMSTGHRVDFTYDVNGNVLEKYLSVNLLNNSRFEHGQEHWNFGPNMSVVAGDDKHHSIVQFQSAGGLKATTVDSEEIPVKANTAYSLSGLVNNNLSAGSFYIDWMEFDANGKLLVDGASVPIKGSSGQWNRGVITFTTTSETARLIVRVVADGNPVGIGYVDDIELVQGVKNPDFLNQGEFWTISPNMKVVQTSEPKNNSIYFKSDVPITSGEATFTDFIAVVPNQSYVLSGWLRSNLSAGSFYIDWMEYDDMNNLLVDGPGIQFKNVPTGEWGYGAANFVTHKSTKKVKLRVVADGGTIGEGYTKELKLEPFVGDFGG